MNQLTMGRGHCQGVVVTLHTCPYLVVSALTAVLVVVSTASSLSAPATSVASEQPFTAAGQIYADRRSDLLGENAEKLLFLAYDIRLSDFTY